jgi:signal transduction histidine kinase
VEQDQIHSHRAPNPIQSSSSSDYERASAQLSQDKDKIKALWEKTVRKKVQVAEDQTSLALQNTLETFLNELATNLYQARASSADTPPGQGMSKIHGSQRAKFAGYFLPQLLKEFSILRDVINEDLNDAEVLTHAVRSTIDQTIDSAISSATTEFASVQQANIRVALQRAEASNRDLEQFAAVAAHDLKSPLATISSFLQLLMDESQERLEKESLEYINLMKRAAERMRSLIDRLLEYARLSKLDKPFQSVNMNDAVNSAVQNLNDTIEKTDAKVTWDHLPIVNGDKDLLIQLFQNLIANSIKFHGVQPPRIHIDFKSQDGMALFSLKDNGIGFDPKDKEEIFALYKKLRGEAEYQGTGIGLATCRKVVELHGGRIWAESTLGSGSVFYFTLPRSKSADTHH